MAVQLVVFGIAIVLFSVGILYRRSILRERILSVASENVTLPIAIPLNIELLNDQRKLGRWLFYFLFCSLGALLGYSAVFMFDLQLGSLEMALFGAVLGALLVNQIRDTQPIDENLLKRTYGHDIVIDHDLIKITRAIPFTGSELVTDEEDYFAIPLNESLRVYLIGRRTSVGWIFSYRIKSAGRNFFIRTNWLGKFEAPFVAALYQKGIEISEGIFY